MLTPSTATRRTVGSRAHELRPDRQSRRKRRSSRGRFQGRRWSWRQLSHVVVAALALSGCSISAEKSGLDTADPKKPTGTSDTTTTNDTHDTLMTQPPRACDGPLTACPQSDLVGAPCPVAGQRCEFEDDPRVACRHRSRLCDASLTLAGRGGAGADLPSCSPITANAPPCGPTREGFEGTACDPQSDGPQHRACLVEGAICTCEPCRREVPFWNCQADAERGGFGWTCASVSAQEPGCPVYAPRLGSACPTEGTACIYDHPPCGEPHEERACVCGVWQARLVAEVGVCPAVQ